MTGERVLRIESRFHVLMFARRISRNNSQSRRHIAFIELPKDDPTDAELLG